MKKLKKQKMIIVTLILLLGVTVAGFSIGLLGLNDLIQSSEAYKELLASGAIPAAAIQHSDGIMKTLMGLTLVMGARLVLARYKHDI